MALWTMLSGPIFGGPSGQPGRAKENTVQGATVKKAANERSSMPIKRARK